MSAKKVSSYLLQAIAAAVILFFAIGSLVAQTSTSIISGTVTDSSGAIIAGAKVDVKNVGTGIVVSLTSDAQGRYRASELVIGEYEVQAGQAGFQTVIKKGVETAVGGEAIVDVVLTVGQSQQVVTVDAQVSQVDTTTSAITNTVTRTQIEELPMGNRNQTDLLLLAPGVAAVASVGGANYGHQENYSISGSRANGISFLIDNTNLATYNGHSTGSAATGATLGLEALGDYQTLTNTYSAQFGGNGGVVNAASKSGTNSLHGSLYFYLTNSAMLSARSTFDTFVRPGDIVAIAPPSHKGLFGTSLGGPVKKNKAFFFVNYEGIRQGAEAEGILQGVPDASAHVGLLPCAVANPKGAAITYACNSVSVDGTPGSYANVGVPSSIAPIMALFPVGQSTSAGIGNFVSVSPKSNRDDYLLTRFDYTLSPKDSLFVRYVRDTALALTSQPNGSTVANYWGEADTTHNHFVTIEEDHVISPTLINLARVSFLRPYENAETTTPPVPALDKVNTVGASQETLALGAKLTLGPTNLVPYRMVEQTYQGMDDVIWTHGAHSIKFGALYAVVADFTNQGNTGAQWTYNNILNFLQALPNQLAASVPGHLDNYRDAVSTQFMPYINDEWKITRKLTLNLGVRYEWLSNPGERHNNLTNVTNLRTNTNFVPVPTVMPNNPSTKNFAPRIGFAYDPFPNHKTSIRGGFGMFYNELTAHIWLNSYWSNAPYQSVTVTPTSATDNLGWPVPLSGGAISAGVPTTGQFGLDYFDHLRTPYMMQYNLSVQREIARGTVFSVAYVGSKGTHLISTRDYNFPVLNASGIVVPNVRPNPNFGILEMRTTNANSNYNSLQAGLNRRFANHFQTQVSYTFSKSMDTGSGDQGPDSAGPTGGNQYSNPLNMALDHARSNFDHSHILKINGIYELPFVQNQFVKGWRLSGVVTAQTGNPFTIFDGFDQTGSGVVGKNAPGHPNLIAGGNQNPILGDVNGWFDVNQFALNPVGTFGNLGRNTAIAPGLTNVNAALLKRTSISKISEQFVLEFRAEATNVFNHANYGLPTNLLWNSASTRNPQAGVITSTNGGARSIQFALKASF